MNFVLEIKMPRECRALARLVANPVPAVDYVGGLAAKDLRAYFRAHEKTKSKADTFFGSDRGKAHWWGKLAGKVSVGEVSASGATLTIGEPQMALQLYGGTVRPKTAKMLAIPLRPEVRGKSVVETKASLGLFLWKNKRTGKSFFAGKDASAKMILYYVRKPTVTVPADPKALPDMQALQAKLSAKAAIYFARKGGAK
jgi:hypothetical protein